jgi:hypothetical protein
MRDSAGSAVIGGVVASFGFYAGGDVWAVLGGAGITALAAVVASRRAPLPGRSDMWGYTVAFAMVSWPVLFFIDVYVWYLLTGRSVGT